MTKSTENPYMDLVPIRKSKLQPDTAIHLAPVPRNVYPIIGQIAVYHGEMERHLNRINSALMAALPDEENKSWENQHFRHRCSLFERKSGELFNDHPEISKKFRQIANEIRLRHAQRAIVVHGQYVGVFPKSGPTRFEVIAKPYRDRLIFEFTEDDLDTIFHEMVMLVGTLSSLCDDTPDRVFSSHDKQTLRDRLSSHLPDLANLPTLPHRQISSPK